MSDDLPQGWISTTVGEVASRVVVGYVGPCRQHYDAKGIPFLMGKNVRASRLLLDDLERVTPGFHTREKKSQLWRKVALASTSGVLGMPMGRPDVLAPANSAW